MYQKIYEAYSRLSKGDQAELKRCNLKTIGNCPAYFRVLKMTGLKDTQQVIRILFLLTGVNVASEKGVSVAEALYKAGVKEQHIIQITRSGDNGVDYLKRQLVRCEHIDLDALGKLAQFWGENARRFLLKDFILTQND